MKIEINEEAAFAIAVVIIAICTTLVMIFG